MSDYDRIDRALIAFIVSSLAAGFTLSVLIGLDRAGWF